MGRRLGLAASLAGMRVLFVALLVFFFGQLPLGAQGAAAQEAVEKYSHWLQSYSEGKELLFRDGRRDRKAAQRFRRLFAQVAATGDLLAAKRLWQAATVELPEELDRFQRMNAQLPAVRGEAKRLIAGIGGEDVDSWLLDKALQRGGRNASLARVTAIEILGLRGSEMAGKKLLAGLGKLGLAEKIQAVLALESCGSLEALPELIKLLRNREPNLRIATISTLAGILSPHSDETKAENQGPDTPGQRLTPNLLEAFSKLLKKEKNWQVRAAVIDGVLRLRSRHSIPALIAAMKAELKRGGSKKEAGTEMLLARIHDGLVALTGQDLPRKLPKLWEVFWKREGARFRFRTVKAPGKKLGEAAGPKKGVSYVRYFNLDIRSKRILFIIDFSGSMREPVSLQGRYAGMGAKQPKFELVKKELEKVIRALPRDTICNVVFFSNEAKVWRQGKGGRPKLVEMNDSNKAALLYYVYETAPGGSTNIYGALELALAMGERGVYDKYYRAAYDSIFLLSDGAPSSGKIVEPDAIRAEVAKINKLRRIRIHTIVFGDESNNLSFMRKLAEENNGRFLHVK
ncbi:MAG: hypothetical protein CSA62_06950 [Planctomycetota bacterium]|nr:MAG: hypothetical protein CSA62_06950 [Planctomycetota bacterium]